MNDQLAEEINFPIHGRKRRINITSSREELNPKGRKFILFTELSRIHQSLVGNYGLFSIPASEEGVVGFRETRRRSRRSSSGERLLWALGRDRRTAIERLRVGGRVKGVGEGWWRVMPPLGQALMGLWASEAYSFHPVSTSRFPSILFHNTPGDVYVLQDARKMRSRLHSDIGRFTAGDGENGLRVERRKRRGAAILAREIGLGFARASRLLFASLYPPYSPDRTTAITLSLSRVHTYLLTFSMRNSIPIYPPRAVQSGIGRFVLT